MSGRGIASVHRVTVCALTRIALRLSARLAIPNAHRAAAVRWIALLGALLDTPIREPMLCHFSGRDFDNLGDGGQAMESNTHGGGRAAGRAILYSVNRAMHFIPLAPLLGGCSANQLAAAHRREGQRLLDQPLKQQSP